MLECPLKGAQGEKGFFWEFGFGARRAPAEQEKGGVWGRMLAEILGNHAERRAYTTAKDILT